MSVVVTTGQSAPGPAGPTGATGIGAVYQSVDSLHASPRGVTDWGPVLNTAIAGGARHFVFGLFQYPFSTPISARNIDSIIFEGATGLGWSSTAGVGDWGTGGSQLLWTGGASPTITGTDGQISTGTKTFNSAAAPFTTSWAGHIGLQVGAAITVNGAGPAGANLVTRIVSMASTTQVTLLDAASTSVTGASYSLTNWTSAIDGQGSQGLQFRDLSVFYNDASFDGILIDFRARDGWSSTGRIRDCKIGGIGTATGAYALAHIDGQGELFAATGTMFANAQSHVRGLYSVNVDDAHFTDCAFAYASVGAVLNPGRFWRFDRCVFFGGSDMVPAGPSLAGELGFGISSTPRWITFADTSFWDRAASDSPPIYQPSDQTWILGLEGHSWFWSSQSIPDIQLLGPGEFQMDGGDWAFGKDASTPHIDVGDATAGARKRRINIRGLGYTENGGGVAPLGWTTPFIANLDTGHTEVKVEGSYLPELKYRSGHETLYATIATGGAQTPGIATSAGQPVAVTASVVGADAAGLIKVSTSSSGATPGALVDITFKHTWPSHADRFDPNGYCAPCVILTPCSVHGFAGAASVDAGAYVIATASDTGWKLAIRNTVVGATDLAWFYRVIKL